MTAAPPLPPSAHRSAGPPAPVRRAHARRRLWLFLAACLAIGVLTVGLALARYLPVLDDVKAVRETAHRISVELGRLEPADVDRVTIERIQADFDELEAQMRSLRALPDDAVLSLATFLPVLGPQVEAGLSLVRAADALTEAGQLGLGLAGDLTNLLEQNENDPSFEMTPALVELVATSTEEVDLIGELVGSADAWLAAIPETAIEPIREAKELVAGPLGDYGPLLDRFREFDDVLPDIMGWGGEKRYLVLAQNPAELRPAGGYAGTVGIITLRNAKLVEQRFQNVYDLDLQRDLPYVEPPIELREHLLAPDRDGNPQSWRLADSAWAADFPTGAQQAAEFYAIEAGVEVDGVIAITTYALDRLLEVIGRVKVPKYDVTVEPGDVTLTLLGATRGAPDSLEGRKDVLDALARIVTQNLLALPPERWTATAEALEQIGRERMALVWLKDESAQGAIEDAGLDGSVRQDAGDYVYVVESNVAPTSKYNLVVDRADSLVVRLDDAGDAVNSLRLDWRNDAGRDGEPFRSLRRFSTNEDGWYGAYVRALVPAGSELVTASGEASDPIRGVERLDSESGRASFANYLLIPPGDSTLTYLWEVPEAARPTGDGWEYRLTVQKQPGARHIPVSVRIDLPTGATVLEATEGAIVDRDRVYYEADLSADLELRVLYILGEPID